MEINQSDEEMPAPAAVPQQRLPPPGGPPTGVGPPRPPMFPPPNRGPPRGPPRGLPPGIRARGPPPRFGSPRPGLLPGPRGPPTFDAASMANMNSHQPPQTDHSQQQQPGRMPRPQMPAGPIPGGGQPQPQQQQQQALKSLFGMSQTDELWVETKTAEDKSYYYNAVNRQTVWERPTGDNVRVVSQVEVEQAVSKAQQQGPPATSAQQPQPAAAGTQPPTTSSAGAAAPPFAFPPPMGMAPPGWPPFPPPFGGMPPMGAGMPPPFMPPGFGGPPGMGPGDPAAVWSEFTAPDGRKYYYNAATAETTWDKPQALKDREAKQKAMAQQPPPQQAAPPVQQQQANGDSLPKTSEGAAQDNVDKSRPISSNPVAGTPWCVVWTGDNRIFFFNPSTRTSVWERPPELYGRPDVDLLVSKAPQPKKADAPQAMPMMQPQSMGMAHHQVQQHPAMGAGQMGPVVGVGPPPAAAAAAVGMGDDSGDDSDELPPVTEQPPKKKKKRQQKENAVEVVPQVVVHVQQPQELQKERPKDPATEAEVAAARERAQVPIEVRINRFKEMLREKEVSAFSTWEKELHKIVFDPRYLLLSSKERKQVFDLYVKERAEEERVERKRKNKEAKENFRNLLEEANLHGKMSFSEFQAKYGKEEAFKGIEKAREREAMFLDHVTDLRKREKQERAVAREKIKADFLELLKEQKGLTKYQKWSDVKKSLDDDPRYKQVDSSSQREDWFRDYSRRLPSESNSDEEEEEARKVRLEGKTQLEREEDAQKERQKEVAEELADQMKERDKEVERHKFQEAEENFKALLADLVRTVDLSWREWRRQLRKDHRWETADLLDKDQKERLFTDHIRQLEKRRKEQFYQLLDDCDAVTLTTGWKEVRKIFRDDPRFQKMGLGDKDRKIEREFREYLSEKLSTAKNDFRDLLRETKIITYKSKLMIQDNEQHLKDILSVLENDKRYLVLDSCPDEREKLLESYLDDLDRRGPPPPPTASEPSRRSMK